MDMQVRNVPVELRAVLLHMLDAEHTTQGEKGAAR